MSQILWPTPEGLDRGLLTVINDLIFVEYRFLHYILLTTVKIGLITDFETRILLITDFGLELLLITDFGGTLIPMEIKGILK